MAKNKKTKKLRKKHVFQLTLIVFALLAGFGVTAATVYTAVTLKKLPSPEQFGSRQINQSTKIYDRTGKVLLYEIHGEEKRTVVPFEEIPEILKKATLAAEDDNFYHRPAFDWKAIVRAFLVNLREGRIVQGGSTITQQLARNVFLSPKKTLDRKIKELILAIELESKYSKDQIFSFYLNQIPYGSNAYGVEAASLTYFNKPAHDLNLAEAALLAALPKAPSYYSPWGSHEKELFERQAYVLDRMTELGHINQKEKTAAKETKIKFAPPSQGIIKAPHFSLTIKEYLIGRYGENAVMNGGLEVITTLDWEMQQIAEKVVAEGAKRNEELYKGGNASLVAQDSKTGQILALVGSRDYFDIEHDGNFNVATQGLRQPGSALKPFAYLTAFQKGYDPKTIVFDVPTEFDTTGNPEKSYRPQNFDEYFRGPVKLETGLAQSINIPSVKILYLAGLDDVLKTIRGFGVNTLKERWRYGLSLILGGGEVKLIELVNAYAALSQEGIKHEQTFVLKVTDGQDNILETFHDQATRVIDEKYPRLITQILSDKNLRAPLFQNSLSLTVFPEKDVALKTGTTNDYRDAWAMGYTPSLAVGVWAGNNDNAPMQRHGGSILAAVPIWSAFLNEVLVKYSNETFTKPAPLSPSNKPMLNGQAINVLTFNEKNYPQVHSILYYIDKHGPLGLVPNNPSNDPQFENWEQGVINWAKINIPNFFQYNLPAPEGAKTADTTTNSSGLVITNTLPKNGDFVSAPLIVKADLRSSKGLDKIELYLNRQLIDSVKITGGFFSYQKLITQTLSSQNLIEIKAEDVADNQAVTSYIVFH